MSLYSLATSKLAALSVAVIVLTGKPATADESQPVPRVPGHAVHCALTVPADAEVWFDGAKTAQGGSYREFVSPPLRPGHQYSYDIRVRWMDGEREVDRTRRVTFYAGDQVNLDFTADRVTGQDAYYDQPSWQYAPSYTIVPVSQGRKYAPRRRVRSFSAQSPSLGRWRGGE